MKAVEILTNLVKMDTSTGKSNKEIIEYIKNVIKNSLAEIIVQKIPGTDQLNLIVKIKGKSSENPLLFVGHTDTVPVSSNWNITSPFDPKQIQNKIYGLGSNDMKGALTIIIITINNITEVPNQDIYFIFSADEESSSIGSKYFIENTKLKNCNVIICEPSDNFVVNEQLSFTEIQVTCLGKSLHTQYADYSTNNKHNAIYKANKIILKLYEYLKNELDNKGFFSVGMISGGTKTNILPDKCTFSISLRLAAHVNMDNEIKKINTMCDGADVKVIESEGPYIIDKNHGLVNLAKDSYCKVIGDKIKISIKKSWTEASLYKEIGKVIIFGPGFSKNSHIDDEFIEIKEIVKFSNIYENIIGDHK